MEWPTPRTPAPSVKGAPHVYRHTAIEHLGSLNVPEAAELGPGQAKQLRVVGEVVCRLP